MDLLTYRLHRINVSPHIFGRAWPSLYYSRASKVFRKLVLHKCAASPPGDCSPSLSLSRLTSLGPTRFYRFASWAVDFVIVVSVVVLLVELQLQLDGDNITNEVRQPRTRTCATSHACNQCHAHRHRSDSRTTPPSTCCSRCCGSNSSAGCTLWDPAPTGGTTGTSTPLPSDCFCARLAHRACSLLGWPWGFLRFDVLLLAFVSLGFSILLADFNTPIGTDPCPPDCIVVSCSPPIGALRA